MKKFIPIFIVFILWVGVFSPFLFSSKMLYGTDFIGYGYYSLKYFVDYIKENAKFPLWDPHIHGGMPFVDAMHGDIFYPLSLPFKFLAEPARAFALKMVFHVFLAGVFMFLLLRQYKLSKYASFFGAVAYMSTPVMVSYLYAGQDGKLFVIALLPLAVWLLERALDYQRVVDFALFGLSFALMILTAHMQMAYFGSWFLGGIFVFRIIESLVKKRYKIKTAALLWVMFIAAIIIGVAICAIQLLPPYYYLGHYSFRTTHTEERGIEYSNTWRLNLEDAFSIAFPEITGVDVGHNSRYWGRNFFKLNSDYVGLLVVILAFAGLLGTRKPFLWFLLGASIFALTYAMGTQTPLFYLYYAIIPGVKKFRAGEMIVYLVAFCTAVASSFAMNEILSAKDEKKKQKKLMYRWVIIVSAVFISLAIILTLFGKELALWWIRNSPNTQGVDISQKLGVVSTMFNKYIGRMWIAILLSTLPISLILLKLREKSISALAITGVASAVLALDLWSVNYKFIVPDSIEKHYPSTTLSGYLQQRWKERGPFRVFTIPQTISDTYLPAFGVDQTSLTEIHGNQLRWYDEFTGRHRNPQNIAIYPHFWDILNIEYILAPGTINLPNLITEQNFGNLVLHRNLTAFPRARAFYRWKVVSHEDALRTLESPAFGSTESNENYRNTLLVEDDPGLIQLDTFPEPVSGKIINNKDCEFDVEVTMPQNGLLFLSQNWYPDWRAEENGKEIKIIRANYSFIAIPLEAGQHKVRFYYFSKRLNLSFLISAVGLGISAIIIALSGWKGKIKHPTSK